MIETPRVRLGVIGLGLIAQAVHLQNLHTLRELFDVTHLCDLSPSLAKTIGDEWGLSNGTAPRVSTDTAELFADPNVDAVLILTPGTHAYLARLALAAGKHVLAEKPLAHTVAETQELSVLAAANDRVLQVAYMKLFDPIMSRARAELESIGTLRLIRITVMHPDDDPQYAHQRYLRFRDADISRIADALRYESDRLTDAVGGVEEPFRSIYSDVFQGSTVHEMAVLRALFDERDLTIDYAQLGEVTLGEKLSEPPQVQALGTLGDTQIMMSWNWLPDYPEYGEEIVVLGSAGRLTLRLPGPYLRDHRAELVVESNSGEERSTNRLVTEQRTGFVHELLAFHASVTEGAPVLSTAIGAGWDNVGLQDITAALADRYGATIGGEAGARRVGRR